MATARVPLALSAVCVLPSPSTSLSSSASPLRAVSLARSRSPEGVLVFENLGDVLQSKLGEVDSELSVPSSGRRQLFDSHQQYAYCSEAESRRQHDSVYLHRHPCSNPEVTCIATLQTSTCIERSSLYRRFRTKGILKPTWSSTGSRHPAQAASGRDTRQSWKRLATVG